MSDNELVAMIVSLVCMTGTFVFVVNAFMNRRPRQPEPPARVDAASEQRLARIEQAVEAIAVEVERISEGQRFTTKLLAERGPSVAHDALKAEAFHGR